MESLHHLSDLFLDDLSLLAPKLGLVHLHVGQVNDCELKVFLLFLHAHHVGSVFDGSHHLVLIDLLVKKNDSKCFDLLQERVLLNLWRFLIFLHHRRNNRGEGDFLEKSEQLVSDLILLDRFRVSLSQHL